MGESQEVICFEAAPSPVATPDKMELDGQLASEGNKWQSLQEEVAHGFITPDQAETRYIEWRNQTLHLGDGALQAS